MMGCCIKNSHFCPATLTYCEKNIQYDRQPSPKQNLSNIKYK